MRDEISIFFKNPATDPLGKLAVEGKLLCTEENVVLRYKQLDRAFKKNEPEKIEFSYAEIESMTYRSKFLGPKILTVCTRGTDKLKSVPGAEVAQIELHVLKESRDEAERIADYVEYRQSEAYLRERDESLSKERNSPEL